jgi:D-glycero-D-manno-heptose 1,7-bisphosphate phosphatase
MNKAVFLDRDGVLNKDFVDYAYTKERFIILDGVPEALKKLKAAGYLLVVITNQSGIGKGIYTKKEVMQCHQWLQEASDDALDGIYYAPHHRSVTASLASKPCSLMIERAVAKFSIDLEQSWFVGDAIRDIEAARKGNVAKTIFITGKEENPGADYQASSLLEATEIILGNK